MQLFPFVNKNGGDNVCERDVTALTVSYCSLQVLEDVSSDDALHDGPEVVASYVWVAACVCQASRV